jgi:GMP synthase-like glutamine amidotransferase
LARRAIFRGDGRSAPETRLFAAKPSQSGILEKSTGGFRPLVRRWPRRFALPPLATLTHEATMILGILETGGPPPPLADRYQGYGDMVRRMLGPVFRARTYDIRAGDMPATPTECEAWLVTGSAAGVYDPEPWIAPLKAFLQDASGQAPMVGICFGHQMMAEAFGGAVTKSPKGWGVGLHRYEIAKATPWMDSAAPISLPVSHQDQVVAIGPGCEVIGGSAFTPFGLLAYPGRNAISMQPHPEFEPDYAQALIESRRGSRMDEATADAAVASLDQPNDRNRVAIWLRRFLSAG